MADIRELVLVAHLVATAGMAGLIWFVQIVHYPLFHEVGEAPFQAYELTHQTKTSWVVGPFMAVEGTTALVLLASPGSVPRALSVVGLVVLGAIHASTVFLQVPRHRSLSSGFDPRVVDSLVRTNWIRTVGWSTRTVLAALMLLA